MNARMLGSAALVAACWLAFPPAVEAGPSEDKPTTKSPRECEIEKKLTTQVALDFMNVPLHRALQSLATEYDIPIWPNKAALEAEGIGLDQPVTVKISGLSLRSALNLLVKEAHLRWVVRDEVLQVTTPADARGKLVTRTFAVTDQIVPIHGFATLASGKAAEPAKLAGMSATELIRLLQNTIDPSSWKEAGGLGTIDFLPLNNALVVHQSIDVQEQIADLLAALRRLQEDQVALEVRFVTVSEETLERVGVDFNAAKPSGEACPAADGKRVLADKQVAALLEAAQGDRRTNILQAPKLTLFNGQTGTVQLTGLRLTAQPVVSADRRSVRVAVKVEATEPAKLVGLDSTVSIPDGGTVVLGGLKTTTEVRREYGPPVLSKVPHVNRLFKNVGYGQETQSVLVLVTPRILATEDARAAGYQCRPLICSAETKAAEPAGRSQKMVAELLRACEAACAEGRDAEAGRYLRAALAIDPGCLRDRR